jgi:hypothetical protein
MALLNTHPDYMCFEGTCQEANTLSPQDLFGESYILLKKPSSQDLPEAPDCPGPVDVMLPSERAHSPFF